MPFIVESYVSLPEGIQSDQVLVIAEALQAQLHQAEERLQSESEEVQKLRRDVCRGGRGALFSVATLGGRGNSHGEIVRNGG